MSDLISRRAAIDAINRAVTKEAARWSVEELPSAEPERCEDCGNFNKTMLLIPQPERTNWIPCAERLPEKNGRYMCTNDMGDAYEVEWNAWINGEWLYPKENPVAWMPLPEAYEGGNE